MDRESLEEFLTQELSLAEIGRRVGRHEATVGYWVARHGLAAARRGKHAARGAMSREALGALVDDGASIAEIAELLGRSKATVRYWLGKYEMRTRGARGRRPRQGSDEARARGLTKAILVCPVHGASGHVREPRGYFRCLKCRQEAVVRRRRKVKAILVDDAGGSCRVCGYDRCLAALAFHHLDPATKEFGVAHAGVGRSIERLRVEARKCILLCSNCHAEVEAGFVSIS
jgi:transposase-like protein